MALFDFPLEQLQTYRPDLAVPADLETFWRDTITEARGHGGAVVVTKVDNGLTLVDSYDVTFPGFGGEPIKAWLHLPAQASGPLPVLATFVGYSGGRGFPFSNTIYAQAGWAHIVMDTRGQSYSAGGLEVTPDSWSGNAVPGHMTRGILDPQTYFYRRVFTDVVRLLDAVPELPQCDPQRIVVAGSSQAGGMTLAGAGIGAMMGIKLVAAMPDVPFLCDFPRATTIINTNPYAEVSRYLASFRDHVEPAMKTLSYFDGAILGRWAEVPTLFSIGLMDDVCPPSTCFAAYNWYGDGKVSDKAVEVYPFNSHEGGADYHKAKQLRWLRERLG